jgi:hypothetical protein
VDTNEDTWSLWDSTVASAAYGYYYVTSGGDSAQALKDTTEYWLGEPLSDEQEAEAERIVAEEPSVLALTAEALPGAIADTAGAALEAGGQLAGRAAGGASSGLFGAGGPGAVALVAVVGLGAAAYLASRVA